MSILLLLFLVIGVVGRARNRAARGLHRADRAVQRQLVVTVGLVVGVLVLLAALAAGG